MEFSTKFVCECREYSTYEKNVPAPLFRKSFVIDKKADEAEILICGLGFYELFVNGKKITKGHLAPYISNTDHYTYFDKYDIAEHLQIGENVIGVMLGDGFLVGKTKTWDFKNNVMNSAPMLALSVQIKCGEQETVFEADEFVCKKGPIIFNDLRSGVFYDARLEEAGWNDVGFAEKDWHEPIIATRPRGAARLCTAEPIKVYREIKPVSIKKGELAPYVCSEQIADNDAKLNTFESKAELSCGYIYDFGENNSGIFRLKIKGKRGQKVSLQCGEQLVDGKLDYSNIKFFPDGFSQRDIYYLKGEGEEIFEPMFTYHGFRYVYVSGITEEQATEDLLTYLVMSSDLEERGTFECSSELVNTIYQMGRRSDISNFFYFPIDCPHREKNGWTGDASVSAEHMIMTIGAENSWREWLYNIRAAQDSEGKLPGIVPTDKWGYVKLTGPAWDSVLFNLPYFAYKFRADTEIIKENAGAMLRYLEYASKKRDGRGVVEYGLGDWVPVNKNSEDEFEAALGFTDSVMVLDMCRKSEIMFDAVGLTLHKQFAQTLGQELLAAIRREYIDFNTYVVKNRCQSSQALAIFFDIFTESEKQKGFDVLMDILKEDNFKLTCGFLGTRVIFHVLAELGNEELAYHMITKDEFPSYGHWAMQGETTFLEWFKEYDGCCMYSKNHHFLGDVVNWFMRIIGGLRVENSNFVTVSPRYLKDIDWCKTTHKLPSGEIEIYWERKDGKIDLQVKTTGDVKYKIV